MTMLEQAQRGVGMVGSASHLFFPGWNASAVSRTVGWFPESAKGSGPHKGDQSPIPVPQHRHLRGPLWNPQAEANGPQSLGCRTAPSGPWALALGRQPLGPACLLSLFSSPPTALTISL